MKVVILTNYPAEIFKNDIMLKDVTKKFHPTTWISNLASSLSNFADCEIHVVSTSTNIYHDQIVKHDKVFYHFIKSPSMLKNLLSFFKIERKLISSKLANIEPDLIHAQNTELCGGYYAAKIKHPNTLLTVHGITHHFWEQASLKEKLFKIHRWYILKYFEKISIMKIQKFISISPYVEQFIKQFNPNASIFSIPNAISQIFFDEGAEKKLDLPNRTYICYIGSIQPRKNLLELIKAIPLLPKQIVLKVVYQSSDRHYLEIIQNYIAENNIANRVEFIGHLDQKSIARILKNAIALVLPSKAETTPMVIVEAMAAGTVPIATNVGGIPFMIIDNENGMLLRTGTFDEIAEKLNKLCSNTSDYERLILNAVNWAKETASPEFIAFKTRDVYKQIIGK